MRLVFIGTPGFAVPPLQHLVRNRHEVVSVYTRPDSLAGRGRRPVSPPVKTAAENLGLPVAQPASLKEPEVVALLAALVPEAIVVAAYGQFLPRAVRDIPRYGCLNLHPSLLPRFRGAAPVPAAILAGAAFTGVTVMLMDEGLDTGPILAQAQIPVSPDDTAGSLGGRLSQVAARLLPDVLVRLERGDLFPRPQDEDGATFCGAINKEDGEIDWRQSAEEIGRRVRAFQPWPGCYTSWGGKRLGIISAIPFPGLPSPAAGQVIAVGEEGRGAGAAFGVGCGTGVLGICRLQLAGKQAVSATDFLRGQRQFLGVTLGEGGT